MKLSQTKNIVVFVLLALMLSVVGASGEVDEAMTDFVDRNLETLFPVYSFYDPFPAQTPSYYKDLGKDSSLYLMGTEGVDKIYIYTNPDGQTAYRHYKPVDKVGLPDDFYFSLDLGGIMNPADGGNCFVAYINQNTGVTGAPEEDEQMVRISVSDAVRFGVKNLTTGQLEEETIPIPEGAELPLHLSIVRLTGETFFYVNDEYVGRLTDGLVNPVQLIYGAEVSPFGDTAECEFDNISVRKVW